MLMQAKTQSYDLALRLNSKLCRSREAHQGRENNDVIIQGKKYLSFRGNDYLGLSQHPAVINAFKKGADRFGVGSQAAYLLGGYTNAHQALEEELAEFTGYPKALLFSSGYTANLAVLRTLSQKQDSIFLDKACHASCWDALLQSPAHIFRFRHNDLKHLQILLLQKLQQKNQSNTFIVTEGVFGTYGAKVPLQEISKLSRKFKAKLILDDAHGLGVLGKSGAGSTELENCPKPSVLTATLSKALGCMGGFVASSTDQIEMLIQFARTYIYTTAMPPAMAEAARASLKILRTESWRREKCQSLISYFKQGARQLGFTLLPSDTCIQALVFQNTESCIQAYEKLRSQGILLSLLRPPTVPIGKDSLRISITATHTQCEINQLLEVLMLLQKERA